MSNNEFSESNEFTEYDNESNNSNNKIDANDIITIIMHDENFMYDEMSDANLLHKPIFFKNFDKIDIVMKNYDKSILNTYMMFSMKDVYTNFVPLIQNYYYNVIIKKNFEIIKLLIKVGCDINKPTDNGFTCLHYAVMINSIELVQLLIDNGCDLNPKEIYLYSNNCNLYSQGSYRCDITTNTLWDLLIRRFLRFAKDLDYEHKGSNYDFSNMINFLLEQNIGIDFLSSREMRQFPILNKLQAKKDIYIQKSIQSILKYISCRDIIIIIISYICTDFVCELKLCIPQIKLQNNVDYNISEFYNYFIGLISIF